MRTCIVSTRSSFESWRHQARSLLAARIPPDEVLWQFEPAAGSDLFGGGADSTLPTALASPLAVPAAFLQLAETVACHADASRFALLYQLLWRLSGDAALLQRPQDAELAKAHAMESAVRRDMHKMKAFVRFREIASGVEGRRVFYAWFEPDHYIVERVAPFFERRFADMDWAIATPRGSAACRAGKLTFDPAPGRKLDASDDTEELWKVYFANIFNPARLKVAAMQSEMPRKYWKNLPEAALIPELIATAAERAKHMQAKAPTSPSSFSTRARAASAPVAGPAAGPFKNLAQLREAALRCTRCPLYLNATQTVAGIGPADAALMFVGEQPGDKEDLQGLPLVGPAGEVFNASLEAAGLEREGVFITNAVKHFKFTGSGKRRIHQTPTVAEVEHCRWWLLEEIRLVSPRVIVAMGATALRSLTGNGTGVTKRRGRVETGPLGLPVMPTLHPAAILRHPDADARARHRSEFFADVAKAAKLAA